MDRLDRLEAQSVYILARGLWPGRSPLAALLVDRQGPPCGALACPQGVLRARAVPVVQARQRHGTRRRSSLSRPDTKGMGLGSDRDRLPTRQAHNPDPDLSTDDARGSPEEPRGTCPASERTTTYKGIIQSRHPTRRRRPPAAKETRLSRAPVRRPGVRESASRISVDQFTPNAEVALSAHPSPVHWTEIGY